MNFWREKEREIVRERENLYTGYLLSIVNIKREWEREKEREKREREKKRERRERERERERKRVKEREIIHLLPIIHSKY